MKKNSLTSHLSYFHYSFAIILLLLYSYACLNFVWHDNLSTFASDSANYLLMALYMSPWKEAAPPIQALWQFQDFPPFFPFILAITGTAHNMYAAHVLTATFLIISLPLIYYISRSYFASNWQALCITIIFSLSPSTWLNNLGILSENLYIFISLLILILFPYQRKANLSISILLGLLIALLILTRTIGISMFGAYMITGFIMYYKKSLSLKKFITPIIITVTLIVFSKLLNPATVPSQYIQQFSNLNILGQPKVLLETWFAAWQYYWIDELIIPHLLVLLIGVLACIGMIIRIINYRIDAFYILLYLCILLVWPHPGQALRFIYPVHAILILYAFYSTHIIFKQYTAIKPDKPILILILISFTIIGPTLSYLWNRYHIGKEYGYHHIHEFYRLPDLKHARYIASIQKTMFNDMKIIKSMTGENDIVLHFSPVYIALLANRFSDRLSYKYADEELNHVNDISKADYIYVTKIHPRRTGKNFKGEELQVYFNNKTEPLWIHYSEENGEQVSIFMKVRH